MINIDPEIIEEIVAEYAEDATTFENKIFNIMPKDLGIYLGTAVKTLLKHGVCKHQAVGYAEGFFMAIAMIEYQKIKNDMEELEKIGKL